VRAPVAIALLVHAGCLGPLVDDVPGIRDELLPAGSVVPSVADDPVMLAQLAANDGVDGIVPLRNAFSAGAPVHVWDFGAAPSFAAPLYVLVARASDGTLAPIAHSTIADAIPGDPGYSPFWVLLFVEVTDQYAGEILPSSAAIDQAIERGLVRAPVLQALAVNCPAVAPDIQVAVGDGMTLPPDAQLNYRGRSVPYFDLGPMPLVDRSSVPEQRRYRLRREGQEPLSEVARNVDLTGDGDLDDTNDLFGEPPGLPISSPLVRTVDVVVPTTVSSIDDTQDDTMAELSDATQLFTPAPTSVVVGYQITDDVRNLAGQRRRGGL
jgi:hypothetical protein